MRRAASNDRLGVVILCNDLNLPCRLPQLGHARVTDPQTDNGSPAGSGIFWAWGANVGINMVTDGTSNTFMAGEQIRAVTRWNAWVGGNASIGSTAVPLNYKLSPPNVGELDPPVHLPEPTTPAGRTSRWPTGR